MCSFSVNFSEDVKQERLHIKIQSLVVQEQFGKETYILTVYLHYVSLNRSYYREVNNITNNT